MSVSFTSVSFAREVSDACSSFSLQLIKGDKYMDLDINMTLQCTLENTFPPTF